MFGNNKKDPLVDAVAKVMQENQVRREVERQFNEDLGIHSKKALPFEKHAEYDRVLAEKTQQALNEGWSMKKEALHPNQQKLDVHEPEKDKLTAKDFEMLRAKKKNIEESGDMGPAKAKKEKTTTYRHKTSGKEVVGVKPPPGDGWEVVKEESTIERIKNNLGLNNEKSPKKDPNYKPDEGPSQADKDALTQKIKDNLDEEKYSAKAARAGEDIGKPGKNFEKIAKKAGERYGSEERGKKVAGAILAKIRAKHMKEEDSVGLGSVKPLLSTDKEKEDYAKLSAKSSADLADLAKRSSSSDSSSDAKPMKVAQATTTPSTPSSTPSSTPQPRSNLPTGAEVDAKIERMGNIARQNQAKRDAEAASTSGIAKDIENWKNLEQLKKDNPDYPGFKPAQSTPVKSYLGTKSTIWEETIEEKAPAGAKFERMVKHIKDKYSKDGLTDKEKSIAYATAWKAKNKEEK